MWCILAAPLMIGCDIRNMNEETKRILMNPEVIAVDQDPLGKQGSRVAAGSISVWCKPLANHELAVGVLNSGEQEATANINWKDLHLPSDIAMKFRDLWKHQDIGTYTTGFSIKVDSHATVLLRAIPVQSAKLSTDAATPALLVKKPSSL
jgi:alpha-galactosidase